MSRTPSSPAQLHSPPHAHGLAAYSAASLCLRLRPRSAVSDVRAPSVPPLLAPAAPPSPLFRDPVVPPSPPSSVELSPDPATLLSLLSSATHDGGSRSPPCLAAASTRWQPVSLLLLLQAPNPKPHTECVAAAVVRTIVEVVQLCHYNGVIHRDLKPENSLFANKKENSPLKAIDFGISIFFKPGKAYRSRYLTDREPVRFLPRNCETPLIRWQGMVLRCILQRIKWVGDMEWSTSSLQGAITLFKEEQEDFEELIWFYKERSGFLRRQEKRRKGSQIVHI